MKLSLNLACILISSLGMAACSGAGDGGDDSPNESSPQDPDEGTGGGSPSDQDGQNGDGDNGDGDTSTGDGDGDLPVGDGDGDLGATGGNGNQGTGGSAVGTGGSGGNGACQYQPQVGQPCNPDDLECGCTGANVACNWSDSAGSTICVDETPQNKPLGSPCQNNFECASDYCYPDTVGGASECQTACLSSGATNASGPGDCCSGAMQGNSCI